MKKKAINRIDALFAAQQSVSRIECIGVYGNNYFKGNTATR